MRTVNLEFEQFLPFPNLESIFYQLMSKKEKPQRPDEYLNRNMPDRVKALHATHRASLRDEQRKQFMKRNPEKKEI